MAEGSSGQETAAARHEIKFVFPHADIEKVRAVLELNCQRIVHRHSVTRVHSLYFDDHRLTDCAHSLEGQGERAKVRLRWYDDPLPSPNCHFEIKRRRHSAILKHRVPLNCSPNIDGADFTSIREGLLETLDEASAYELSLRPNPSALIIYNREHFQEAGRGIRLTLDHAMIGFGQIGKTRLNRHFPISLGEVLILEAKCAPRNRGGLRQLLHPINPRISKFSKYVTACQLMGWNSGSLSAVTG